MSTDNAKRLVQALKDDPSLQERFKKAGASGFHKVASETGYDTTPQELAAALNEAVVTAAQKNEPLFAASDGIVSGVAGGTSGHVSSVVTGIA